MFKRIIFNFFELLLLLAVFQFIPVQKVYATCTMFGDNDVFTSSNLTEYCENIGSGSQGLWISSFGSKWVIDGMCKYTAESTQKNGYCYHLYSCDTPCSSTIPQDTSPTDVVSYGTLRGYIWVDENSDGASQPSEFLTSKNIGGTFTCPTSEHVYSGFFVIDMWRGTLGPAIQPDPAQIISSWSCNGAENLIANAPMWATTKSIAQASPRYVYLLPDSIPFGYECDKWYYQTPNRAPYSGTGCLAGTCCGDDRIYLNAANGNFLTFKLKKSSYKVRLTGWIKSDEITAGTYTSDWTGVASSPCSNFLNTNFKVNYNATNRITSWTCNSGTSKYNTSEITVVGPSASVTLAGLPAGYSCVDGCTQKFFPLPSTTSVTVNWEICKKRDAVWSPWDGICDASGNEHRTCTPGSCGGIDTCVGPDTRPCSHVIGKIWSDQNGDGSPNLPPNHDYWGGDAALACSPRNKVFLVNLTGITPIVPLLSATVGDWLCNASSAPYFNTPRSIPRSDTPSDEREITLNESSLPVGYKCSSSAGSWTFKQLDSGGNLQVVETGTGCSAKVSIIVNNDSAPGAWDNQLTWRIAPGCETTGVFNLTVNVNETSDPSNCTTGVDAPNGLKVTITKDGAPTTVISGTVTAGSILFSSIPAGSFGGNVVFKVDGIANSKSYNLSCPQSASYTTNLGAVACDNKTVNLGVKEQTQAAWITSIDADIFAGGVAVGIPADSPSVSGFKQVLINSEDNQAKGYIFSEGLIPFSESSLYESNLGEYLGGYAQTLGNSPSHKSKWLESFSFAAPEGNSGVIEITSLSGIQSGKVYKMKVSDFNSLTSTVAVNYPALNNGLAILYLYETGDVTIKNNITTTGTDRLVIITDQLVTIGSNPGFDIIGNYVIGANPKIMASIISQDGITFDKVASGDDKPIMVTAPLVSNGNINFNRNIGSLNNFTLPSESVKANPKFIYQLSELERNQSSAFLNYTGLTTFDLDWEYIY